MGNQTKANKPNVLLIVVDSLRNDHFLGKSNAQTPFLNSLRKESTVFTQAISTSSTTSPCFSSILTGKYSFKHGVRTLEGYALSQNVKTIAGAFKEAGYHTIAEVSIPLSKKLGLDKGFDEYNFRGTHQTIYSKWGKAFIEKIGGGKIRSPFFIVLHLWELHRMRFMARAFNKPRYGKIAYERGLSCLDFYLKKLFNSLDKNAVIILTADHGEKIPKDKLQEYFNHLCIAFYAVLRTLKLSKSHCKRESHGFDLSEDLLRIPLLFKGKMFPRGKVIEQQVGQVDIATTLEDLFGLDLGKGTDGKSLLPLIGGKKIREWPVFIEACDSRIPNREDWLEGIRTSKWKYGHAALNEKIGEELYYLGNDSNGKRNLVHERHDILGKMKEKLRLLKNSAAA